MLKIFLLHARGTKEVEMLFNSAEDALSRLGIPGRGIETLRDSTGEMHRVDLKYGFSMKKGEVLRRSSLAFYIERKAG